MKAILDILTVEQVRLWVRARIAEAQRERDLDREYLMREVLRLLDRWRRLPARR